MSRKLRAGVLGAGSWSTVAHIPVLRDDPDVELVVLCRRDERLGTTMATEHGFAVFEPDWRKALRHDLDLVVINSPPAAHVEQVCASLEAGAHVLCEKPFALNLADATSMVDAANRAGRTLLTGFGWNRHPTFARTRELVTTMLGAPEYTLARLEVGVRELFTGDLPAFMRDRDVPPDPATYTEPAISGGGALFGNASHALGMMLWVCGRGVRSIVGHAYHAGPPPLDLHDAIWAEYEDGSQVSLAVVSVPSGQGRVRWSWTSYAAAGTVSFDSVDGPVTFVDADGRRHEYAIDSAPHTEALEPTRCLLRAAKHGDQFADLSGELGAGVVALTDAIVHSWQRGEITPVHLTVSGRLPPGPA